MLFAVQDGFGSPFSCQIGCFHLFQVYKQLKPLIVIFLASSSAGCISISIFCGTKSIQYLCELFNTKKSVGNSLALVVNSWQLCGRKWWCWKWVTVYVLQNCCSSVVVLGLAASLFCFLGDKGDDFWVILERGGKDDGLTLRPGAVYAIWCILVWSDWYRYVSYSMHDHWALVPVINAFVQKLQ